MRSPVILTGLLLAFASTVAHSEATPLDISGAQRFLQANCSGCHAGKSPAGGLDIARLSAPSSIHDRPDLWTKAALRVRNGEMPPGGHLGLDEREAFVDWVEQNLRKAACSDGLTPGPAPIRRLSRSQYTATVRDSLNLHVDGGALLPPDGAGGEGFDNAAETLFLSPVYAEKYLDAAKAALNYATKDPRSRAKFLIAAPGPGVTPEAAARTILEAFLPRAFRRPVEKADLDFYVGLFSTAAKRGESFEESIFYSLRAVLIS